MKSPTISSQNLRPGACLGPALEDGGCEGAACQRRDQAELLRDQRADPLERRGEHSFSGQSRLTFRQALPLGGNVRNGERGTTFVYADRFVTDAPEQARAAIVCCAILLCSASSLLLIRACHEHFIKRSDYSARILDVREQRCLCFASRLWSLSCSRDSNWMGNHFGPSSPSRARARRRESVRLGDVVSQNVWCGTRLFDDSSRTGDLACRTAINLTFVHRA